MLVGSVVGRGAGRARELFLIRFRFLLFWATLLYDGDSSSCAGLLFCPGLTFCFAAFAAFAAFFAFST